MDRSALHKKKTPFCNRTAGIINNNNNNNKTDYNKLDLFYIRTRGAPVTDNTRRTETSDLGTVVESTQTSSKMQSFFPRHFRYVGYIYREKGKTFDAFNKLFSIYVYFFFSIFVHTFVYVYILTLKPVIVQNRFTRFRLSTLLIAMTA